MNGIKARSNEAKILRHIQTRIISNYKNSRIAIRPVKQWKIQHKIFIYLWMYREATDLKLFFKLLFSFFFIHSSVLRRFYSDLRR
jgi:hypothetical protein